MSNPSPSSPAAPDTSIRRATPADAPSAGRICYEAFHRIGAAHGFAPHFLSPEALGGIFETLFTHPNFNCVIAERDGQLIASNCLDERNAISGVGPITVSPGAQNAGVGKRLMEAVLERAREQAAPGVRLLQAAYHARSLALYASLGFDAREPISLISGPPIGKTPPGFVVRPATDRDLDDCAAICHNVHGHNRTGELRDSIHMGSAVVVERGERITGYSSAIGFLGHSVAETNEDLKALIASANQFSGPGILVPTRNAALFRWCLEQGLRVIEPLTLMSVGLYNEPAGAYLPSITF